ncbi:hypothetical protein [Halorubrum sp. CSM-61]|nr:hypothetical protein [Halorubrum sp. CSM-61]
MTYDLMEDDDVRGLGVGCNDVIDILLEPLASTAVRPRRHAPPHIVYR